MGVKLIDVEDAVLDAIDRLPPERDVAEQADVPRAVSGFKREATVLGVGAASEMATATPIVAIVPGGERTVLGVGTDSAAESEPVAAQEPSAQRASSPPHKPAPTREASVAREPSVVIDLVEGHPAKPPKTTGASEIPTVVKRRRGARWFLVFALLLLAGVGAYVLLGAEPERLQRLLGTPAPPAPSATASPQTSTTATIVSWPNASASASAHSLGSASSTATGHATAPAPATSSASARASTSASAPSAPASAPRPPKKPQPPAEDNPY
jgi:hypothetical protein